MDCKWDCRVERVRWEEGGRGEMRDREPLVEVRRRERRGERAGRRVSVEGYCPV